MLTTLGVKDDFNSPFLLSAGSIVTSSTLANNSQNDLTGHASVHTYVNANSAAPVTTWSGTDNAPPAMTSHSQPEGNVIDYAGLSVSPFAPQNPSANIQANASLQRLTNYLQIPSAVIPSGQADSSRGLADNSQTFSPFPVHPSNAKNVNISKKGLFQQK